MTIGIRDIVNRGFNSRRLICAAGLMISTALAAGMPLAPAHAQPVVQPIGDASRASLNAALARLARNPRDVDALIDAGSASLAAGDGDAAIGFYQKADTIALPGNARVKAGLAGAYVLSGDPVSAIPLFDLAERSGGLDAARVADRGLAYDLIGDPLTAQVYYREALAAAPSDETSRRLALSQAVSGDRRGMEVTLGPLLQRQDKAAWRIRSFALAILGQVDEAESITRSTMPSNLADAVAGYLRYMPRLTAAQQAGAANLGLFPRASEIGQIDPRFAQFVRARSVLASADRSLTPAGPPMGQRSRDDRKARERQRDRPGQVSDTSRNVTPAPAAMASAPAVTPVLQSAGAVPTRELPAVAASSSTTLAAVTPPLTTAPVSVPPLSAVPVAAPPAAAPAPAAPPVTSVTNPAIKPVAGPSFTTLDDAAPPVPSTFNLKQVAATSNPAAPAPSLPASPAKVEPLAAAPLAPAPVAKRDAVPAAKPRSLADVFADLTAPSRETVPQPGAVDLRKLKPQRLVIADKEAADKACIPAVAAGSSRTGKGKVVKAAAKSGAPAQCKDDKASGPVNPSRIWVQVATGRDKRALGSDWRRMAKEEAEVLRGKSGFTSNWGQTNRLLTGPFESEAKATAFISQLRKAGVAGAFVWSSPAGQVVDPLAGNK